MVARVVMFNIGREGQPDEEAIGRHLRMRTSSMAFVLDALFKRSFIHFSRVLSRDYYWNDRRIAL